MRDRLASAYDDVTPSMSLMLRSAAITVYAWARSRLDQKPRRARPIPHDLDCQL